MTKLPEMEATKDQKRWLQIVLLLVTSYSTTCINTTSNITGEESEQFKMTKLPEIEGSTKTG